MRYANLQQCPPLPNPAELFERPLGAPPVTPIPQSDGMKILRENSDRIEHTADIRVTPVMTFADPNTELLIVVSVARNLEQAGRQPCVRFYREGGKIVGLELSEAV